MDPIGDLCRLTDSFLQSEPIPQLSLDLYLSSADRDTKVSLVKDINLEDYYDLNLWDNNKDEEEKQQQDSEYDRASLALCPITSDKFSIFTHNEGVPLANIDIIYHFTGDMFKSDNLDRRIASGFGYIILGRNDGWVQYLQYRCPNSDGYGLNSRSSPWDMKALNMSRFRILYGDDGSGEVDININWLIDFLSENQTVKSDLILCAEAKYFTSTVLLALNSCILGGNAIFKLETYIDPSILYCLCQSFEHSSFFYPFTANPNSNHRYLICWNRLPDQILENNKSLLYEILSSGQHILFPQINSVFATWLKRQNQDHLNRWAHFLAERGLALRDPNYRLYPPIDLYKLKLVLSLPINDRGLPGVLDGEEEHEEE